LARDPSSDRVDEAALEQRERAEGAFEIHIDVAPADDAAFHRLRTALRLSRADIPWLKERVPGVVRRGARVDLLPVLGRIREVGHQASLRRRGSEPGP